MDEHRFFVEKIRFHLTDANALVFVGWYYDGTTREHTLSVKLDGEPLTTELQINKGAEVRQKYLGTINEIQEEVVGIIHLPEDWREHGKLTIETSYQGEWQKPYAISCGKLRRIQKEVEYYVENCHRDPEMVTVTGWCMAPGDAKLVVTNAAGDLLSLKSERYFRRDLMSVFPDADTKFKPGFMLQVKVTEHQMGPFFLEMRSAQKHSRTRLKNWDKGSLWQTVTDKGFVAYRYFQRNGWDATIYKINSKLRKKETNSYDAWRKKYEVTPEELEHQRQDALEYQPLFSVVVPLYNTKPEYLREMIESMQGQTYRNWELCMADGSPRCMADESLSCQEVDSKKQQVQGETALTPILQEYASADERIHFMTLEQNEGIAGNTNAALAMATGDYIVLADHDDVVPANALYEFAAALNRDKTIEVLYSDEDKISMDGKHYFEPHFKPDFSIDLLCSVNYICHLFAAKREVIAQAGEFREEYNGAQDLDFILRCTEVAKNIYHVPKILYHWRCHMESTAANPESKLYAFEAGRRAIEAHYERLHIPAKVENAQFYGMYRTIYQWDEEPLVSIIIPNKDHAEDLAKCVNSIFEKSDYRNFEFVIVENNSTEPETFAYYKKLEAEHENVKVVFYKGGFNYSKINNFGAAAAQGEYFLLLNNDTEMIDAGGIRELLGYCMREDVGIVGAKLLYEDETIQHAGVVVGFGGTAGHAFIGKARYDTGYFGRILCAQNYSAVTAACLMTKRSVFEQVGGLTEELAVAFNDVDYCLKVRAAGKLVVYNPYAEFFHYESKSRGYEDSPEKVERFNGEVEILLSHWRDIVENGDPYYNRNLTLDNSDFSLRR